MDGKHMKTNVHLSQEIMEEILSRLPMKSLMKFRCVSLISSQRFVEIHLRNSTKNKAMSHHKFIFESAEGVYEQCSLQQLAWTSNEASSVKILDSTSNDPLRKALVVGCCDGLLCFSNYQRDLSLWNPATKMFMQLPKLGLDRDPKYGFGRDRRSGAYKVFAVSSSNRGNVYSSKTNSWKTVEHGCLDGVYNRTGVFACGKIHWIIQIKGEGYAYIESFDLESEEFGRIEVPFSLAKTFYGRLHKLAEIGGRLHLCFYVRDRDDDTEPHAAVWVMKESGWLKLFTHPLVVKLSFLRTRPVFGGGPNGEIFLMFYDNFLVYDPKDDVVRKGKNRFRCYDGYVYVESLVSPRFYNS